MPYREIKIGNETFVARVSDEAIEEWLTVRERNKVIGYPDRPPDIDTVHLRSWIVHPNEVGYIGRQEVPKASSFIVYTIAFSVKVDGVILEHKMLVSYGEREGLYKFRLVLRHENGETLDDVETYADHDKATYFLDEALEKLAFIADFSDEVHITAYDDYAAIDEETNLALKELDEYYGKPLVN